MISGSVFGAFEVQMFQKVGSSAGLFGFVSASAFDED